MSINGFFYGSDGRNINKIQAPKHVIDFVKSAVEPNLKDIDNKTYWYKYAIGMLTHAPQGYLAYKGASLWILNDGRIKIVEFTYNKLRACIIDIDPKRKYPEGEDPTYDIAYIPWDWLLEKSCKGTPCSKSELKEIGNNVDWTNKVHEEMTKIIQLNKVPKA